ncbi:carboxymuconolactone decarboxylase family protein [Jeotgalibacillus proteolyticus]|uniref:Alkylhydroperoxidase n=1 Tax=Jeotgalibacillus proteolyticus TaxID=2082395 RepID=A0A2S5GD46_9BACL|nr:carboxymuconolactone decarboxylase family protein [Jeotgalibacillus proteolyticus]PPA70834.1 alkylhydroperoxidase [Jeotgalibacillus proteolyticus]
MENRAESILERYRKGIDELGEYVPVVVKEYNSFTGKSFEDGEIDRSHKHLMAFAISIKDGDEASITYHLDQCVAMDCSDQQIYEAMAVAAAYGGGSAMSQGVTTGIERLKDFRQR